MAPAGLPGPGGDHSQRVFKHAVTRMPAAIMEGMVTNDLKLGDIDMVIPHQANLRINQPARRRAGAWRC